MKKDTKTLIIAGVIGMAIMATVGFFFSGSQSGVGGATKLFPGGGGTGTTTVPVAGDFLLSQADGSYGPAVFLEGTNITLATSTTADGRGSLTITSTSVGEANQIATSSAGVVSSLLFYTTAGATPELVDPVATTTLSDGSTLTVTSGTLGALVGGSNAVLDIDLTNPNDWTDLQTFVNASTTQFSVSDKTWLTNITSALTLTGADGLIAEYTGTTCTNQFVRVLSVLGVATCASVNLTNDVTGTISAGSYGATTIDGDDINSNIAGRSLTLTAGSPDTLDADPELFTDFQSANLIATSSNQIATSTTPWLSKFFGQAATITSINCIAYDSGTSTIKVQIDGTDVLYGTGLQCGADEAIASSTLANTAVSSGQRITVFVQDAEPTGSRPRLIEVTPVWTYND